MGLVEADFDKKKPATFKMEVMKEALKIVDPSALLGVVGEVGPRLVIKPFVYNPQISPRQLISIGGMRSYAKGFLSLTGAAGGVGKSTQSIAEELSLVTGKDLLTQLPGFPAPPLKCGRQRVWVMSLEDDEKEHQRRVNAALKLYGIDPKELVGWYFVTYKNDSPVNVASVSNGVFVANPQVQLIGQAIKDHAIDVLIVDRKSVV